MTISLSCALHLHHVLAPHHLGHPVVHSLTRPNDAYPFGCALLIRSVAVEPNLHAGEIEVHDGGGVERQELAEGEASHHGVAERLAQLGSGPVTERERDAGEHRGRGRHQDRTEAQQAGLTDRRDRWQMTVTFGHDREVHQHNAVLLDDADQ